MSNKKLDQFLAPLDRDALISLIKELVERAPQFEALLRSHVEAPLVDGKALSDEIRYILTHMGDHWRSSAQAQLALDPLVLTGNQHLEHGNIQQARLVYKTIADAILKQYIDIRDQESEVAYVVIDCIHGLENCLKVVDVTERREILRDVFAIFRWDIIDHGGYGIGDVAKKIFQSEMVSIQERDEVVLWIRDALSFKKNADHYSLQSSGRLILNLVGDRIDRDERRTICRETALHVELVQQLLAEGCLEDARILLREAHPFEVVAISQLLIDAGYKEQALIDAEQNAAVFKPGNHHLRRWLAENGAPVSDVIEELVSALTYPLHNATELKKLLKIANKAGRRHQVMQHVIAQLNPTRRGDTPVLLRALAAAGQFEESLALIDEQPKAAWKNAALDVAEIAASMRPDVAADVYQKVIEELEHRDTKPARRELINVRTRLQEMSNTDIQRGEY